MRAVPDVVVRPGLQLLTALVGVSPCVLCRFDESRGRHNVRRRKSIDDRKAAFNPVPRILENRQRGNTYLARPRQVEPAGGFLTAEQTRNLQF